jgi:very-short-patch-repair endonuclease
MREKRHHEPPDRRARARQLRREASFPERLLWSILRNRRLGGLKWRRQAPIGRYVVDYVSFTRRLIVELDGESHVGQAVVDAVRTRFLEAQGFRVVRVTNDDLLQSPEAVAQYIARQAGLDW